jgi:hypothetical protein
VYTPFNGVFSYHPATLAFEFNIVKGLLLITNF